MSSRPREGSRSRVPRRQASRTDSTLERFVHAENPFVNAYECKREFKEECVQWRVGWVHSPVGGVIMQMTPMAGGQGHAPFVGAVACDLSWREGRPSVFGVQGGRGKLARRRRTGYAGGRARLHEETCARSRDDAWLRRVSEKLALPRKVDRPSGNGSPCRGGTVKVAVGLSAKDVLTHLYGEIVHEWASSSPLPRLLQGGVRSSELPIVSLQLGAGLGELPLRLWLAGEFLILWRVGEVLADSMDCSQSRVEGLHGGIAQCMVWCYRDRPIYGWGLPTQGCEFLEIERRSLGPVRWHSRLDPFLYSKPLTNLASYFGARGISDVKAINEHASKQTGSSPNPLSMSLVESPSYANPNFNLVGARNACAYATQLGKVHLPGDARRTHVRGSCHLLFTTRRSSAVESPGSRATRYT
ncbi:hypothetical protein CRG98_030998 [Punica granatum]|uniref:Uncharacterized protein n=1 Tax=Punica granatum TaxID=22663 RepID=A0A2I0IX15_PUNGR|nr:hypothetical protein CRG98_030998 [Punica granatum]